MLVTRFGAGNVFQDVNAMSLGHDFRVQVEAAIATSDAVLIVIGSSWLQSVGDGAGRRIDQENDFVRLEVSLALSSGIPVVPVLVDRAVLPSSDELPDDMAEMIGRHAATIRNPSDDSWTTGWSVCEPPTDTWTPVGLARDRTAEIVDDDAHTVGYEVLDAAVLDDGVGGAQVMIEIAATTGSATQQTEDNPNHYYDGTDFGGLLIDGVQFDLDCFGPITGREELAPDDSAIAWVGFVTAAVPSGART